VFIREYARWNPGFWWEKLNRTGKRKWGVQEFIIRTIQNCRVKISIQNMFVMDIFPMVRREDLCLWPQCLMENVLIFLWECTYLPSNELYRNQHLTDKSFRDSAD
jgi:hypothetical protein